MKPAPFAYHRAHSVGEAVALLAELGDEAKILAGGLSLVPMMNFRLARPTALVDVTRIEGLSYLRIDAAGRGPAHRRAHHAPHRGAQPRSRGPGGIRRAAPLGPLDRALPDPQPGHLRRQHRARGPRLGMVPARGAARRAGGAHGTGRGARRPGPRILPGLLHDDRQPGRDDHRAVVPAAVAARGAHRVRPAAGGLRGRRRRGVGRRRRRHLPVRARGPRRGRPAARRGGRQRPGRPAGHGEVPGRPWASTPRARSTRRTTRTGAATTGAR